MKFNNCLLLLAGMFLVLNTNEVWSKAKVFRQGRNEKDWKRAWTKEELEQQQKSLKERQKRWKDRVKLEEVQTSLSPHLDYIKKVEQKARLSRN